MHKDDLITLFDYGYWANQELLSAAARLSEEAFLAPSTVTTRDLRATLVHNIDVDWSWRKRLGGEPRAVWEQELDATHYAGVADVATRAQEDEREMRAWLAGLDEARYRRPPDVPDDNLPYPLWQYLMHLVVHDGQGRSDAAVLLTLAGESPGNFEFLDYVDAVTGSTT